MNLTDTETLKFLKGSPVLLEDICAVYPATLGEIVDIGYDKFQTYLSVLTSTKPTAQYDSDKELKELMKQLTDFQYILMMATLDKQINNSLKEGFKFFTHEDILISLEPAQIIVGPAEEQHILTESKYYDLQRLLRRMYFLETEN